MRDESIDSVLDYGRQTAVVVGILPNFLNQRRRKVKVLSSEAIFTPEQEKLMRCMTN